MAEDRQYQSLYRKYRPQGPQEVLGQEHVVRALMGAVREGRLAHAFLFCGPRGTGKTSTARILAKMVNCEQGPTPEPCGTCAQCVAIREGTHLDVVEIDAASHGGVDDARDLREKAPTAPVQGREKVYIIDEAQRLSREAFDALLKVFEEPPPGVRFVLATTEPHKMPPTIIGRCQRFDFHRGSTNVVSAHLLRVAKQEGIALTEPAAEAMARQAGGSFRDALSLLDQASVLGAGEVDERVVESLIGAGRSEVQYALADAVSLGDARSVFEIVDRVVREGNDVRHVTSETLTHFRDLLLAKAAPEQADLLDVTEDQAERLRAQAAKFSSTELTRVISLLLAAQADMRWTTSPRLSLELALVRATLPETDAQPQALLSRVERLERLAGIDLTRTAAGGVAPAEAASLGSAEPSGSAVRNAPRTERAGAKRPSEPTSGGGPSRRAKAEGTEASGEAGPEPPPAPQSTGQSAESVLGAGTAAVDVAMIRRSWPALIQHLRSNGKAVLPSFLELATPAAFDGRTLELVFPPDSKLGVGKVAEREHELRAALQELFGISPKISCSIRESVAGASETVEEDPPLPEEEALARLTAELGAQPSGEGES
ncbi:MAG TPA: DNA polymerase III subunit gamma/tau [Actinomycetota bacterium]|nr:DNA polymerase III subunit gamma/tau [Actinomycetota bacterium]